MKTIDYNLIPQNFLHCCNSECTRAEHCLRQVAFRSLNDSRKEIRILNPRLTPGETCRDYCTSEPQVFRRGLTHLYDNMTLKTAKNVRATLYTHFGNTQYYRIVNGERAVSPDEQAYICRVLKRNGITDQDVFDGEELRLVV